MEFKLLKKGNLNVREFLKNLAFWKNRGRNIINYYMYILKAEPVKFIGVIVFICESILFFFNLSKNVIDITNVVITIITLFINFFCYINQYDEKFTYISNIDNKKDLVKAKIFPPSEEWKRLDLYIMSDTVNFEAVYINRQIDNWLRGNKQIGLKYDKNYSKNLKLYIKNHVRWKDIFKLFLKNAFFSALYEGKQFYNEKKFGISKEFELNDTEIFVHKTCYFDSYLTNIIPGKTLMRSIDKKEKATTLDLLPYVQLHSNKYILEEIGESYRANEPGVTTLCIFPNDVLYLWRQNRLAMSSIGQIVATGSGSSDWKDCKDYFKDKNGFRKAIIKGMQRELYEESFNKQNKHQDFHNKIDTRIIGYFRWLKKSGKSEFVGISRITDPSMLKCINPQKTEVMNGIKIDASTIYILKNQIKSLIYIVNSNKRIQTKNCSVSCTMALLYLKKELEICCEEKCHKNCSKSNCKEKPSQLLFNEKFEIVKP